MVALHVTGGYAEDMLAEARQNPELAGMRCFGPLNQPGPWNYPICVAQLTPPARPAFNILRQDGWSGAEEWGHWVEGTEARASWAAPMRKSSRLALDIFPICVPGRPQGVTIEVNGKILTTHQWRECEPWQSEVVIPEDLIQVGWNDIVLRPTGPSTSLAGRTPIHACYPWVFGSSKLAQTLCRELGTNPISPRKPDVFDPSPD
jgi:hypothetical protein